MRPDSNSIITNNNYYTIQQIYLSNCNFSHTKENIKEINVNGKFNYDVSLASNYQVFENVIVVALHAHIKFLHNDLHIRTLECSFNGNFICNDHKNAIPDIKTFATVNAPAIIFPYLRQFVSYITEITGFPILNLPIVTIKPKE
jgi:preprotein translocase subunit SecB